MRDLIERLLRQAVQEQIERLFTYRNLQAVRDRFVTMVDEAVKSTSTPYDDLVWRITRRLLDDDNLAELYNWVTNNFGIFSADTLCKAQPYDFASLQDKLELTDTYKLRATAQERAGDKCLPAVTAGELCAAAIPWADVVMMLRIILPILMEWYNR